MADETAAGTWIPDATEPYPEEDWWRTNTEALEALAFGLAEFDAAVDNDGDSFVTQGVYVDGAAQTFTPPAPWGSYVLQVVAYIAFFVTTGDELEALVQIDGVDGPSVDQARDTNQPEMQVVASQDGLTGPVDYRFRARNNDDNSGLWVYATYSAIGWRRS